MEARLVSDGHLTEATQNPTGYEGRQMSQLLIAHSETYSWLKHSRGENIIEILLENVKNNNK